MCARMENAVTALAEIGRFVVCASRLKGGKILLSFCEESGQHVACTK